MGRKKGEAIKLYELYNHDMELVMIGTSFQIAEYMGKDNSWWVHSKLRQQKEGGVGYCSRWWVEPHEKEYILYDKDMHPFFQGTRKECIEKLGITPISFSYKLNHQDIDTFRKYWIEEVVYE